MPGLPNAAFISERKFLPCDFHEKKEIYTHRKLQGPDNLACEGSHISPKYIHFFLRISRLCGRKTDCNIGCRRYISAHLSSFCLLPSLGSIKTSTEYKLQRRIAKLDTSHKRRAIPILPALCYPAVPNPENASLLFSPLREARCFPYSGEL